MNDMFHGLLSGLSRPDVAGTFNVIPLPGHSAYYVARASEGSAALLIKTSGRGRPVPLQLAGIEARFGMQCRISDLAGADRDETLSAIICISQTTAIELYFASLMGILISLLGDAPTLAAVSEAVNELVALFQRLRKPPRKHVTGVVGELLTIRAAREPRAAITAWHVDPDERFDFASGTLRLEVKATSGLKRLHSLSLDQASPSAGILGLLASVIVMPSGGGTSVGELMEQIEGGLADHTIALKLRTIVADTLGRDLPAALGWRFDLHHALGSLLFFDLRTIPAIRGTLPAGVSNVRFTTDLSECVPLSRAYMSSVRPPALGLLPS